MGDRSLESGGGLSGSFPSQTQMSLFDEEILFDDDPNKAYFNYMVGMDNMDDSLIADTNVGSSTLRHDPKETMELSKDIQQRWMQMAEGKASLDDETNVSGPNTIADESLLRNGDAEALNPTAQKAHVPPVIYVGQEAGKTVKEQALTVPSGADWTSAFSLRSGDGQWFWKKRKVIVWILVLFFLAMVGLIVALVFAVNQNDDKGADPNSNTQGGDASDITDTVPTVPPTSRVPTPSPSVQVPMTAAPTEPGSTEPGSTEPGSTEPESTPVPTISPTVSPTVSPTTPPTVSPTTLPPTTLPSTVPQTTPPAPTTTQEPAPPEELQNLITFLSSISPDGGAALSDTSSPQFMAAAWLSQEPDLLSYSERKIIQRYTMATFYYSLGGPSWQQDSGWLTTADECDWYNEGGNNCNGGDLFSLYLPSNNLRGTLPSELALLADTLEKLDVTDNGITGTIPTVIGLLTSLNRLSVKYNSDLSGSLPTQLGSLTGLTSLGVGRCQLGGNIPSEFGSLTDLGTLGLERNRFSGNLPTEMGQMTSLYNLFMDFNRLSGTVPTQVMNLPNLKKLALDGNNFTGTVEGGCDLRVLRADCEEVTCECCTECCVDGQGCRDN